jgi:ABC-type antimicrobial peptide transport system permease subunit
VENPEGEERGREIICSMSNAGWVGVDVGVVVVGVVVVGVLVLSLLLV